MEDEIQDEQSDEQTEKNEIDQEAEIIDDDSKSEAISEEIKPHATQEENTPEFKPTVGWITKFPIIKEMEQSYLDYAMSVIIARALPDARDGLKPVHRRIIYAMGEMNLTSTAKYTKSSKIVGEVLGKYHPHGDMAVYDTIVGMAQFFKMNHMLVDGQGNFGSMDGDSAAAPRYTEARMSAIAERMLNDIDKDTVDFTPNYDNTLKEPTVLPTRVPNLLLNGTVGIAVGMATNIPPHNLGELCDGISHLIDNPAATIEDLMQFVKGPDFPTGATIYGAEGIKNAFATGKGKIVIRGESEIVEDKKGFKIIISSIPFQVNKADLITKIAMLVKDKKVEGITDIRDESDRNDSVRIVIELKSTAYPKKVLNRIYDLTTLQTAFHINMLALVDRIQPRILNLRSALQEFVGHRQIVVRRRTQYDLDRAREREHILEGLKKALDHIDEIIDTIKKSANREEAQKNLIAKFQFSELQANAILDMRLAALAALERQRIEDELAEKRRLIAELEAILADNQKVLKIIKDELGEIKEKFAHPRKTKIIDEELGSFRAEDLIPNETVSVTITKSNYIKRVSIDAYRKQGRGGKGMIGITPKEEDEVIQMETASTHDTVFFFTNFGKVFSTRVYEIPPSQRQARGQAIVNLIQISPEEMVTAMLIVPKGESVDGKFFTFATELGTIKRTEVSAYMNIRKTGLLAIKLRPKDELKFIKITGGDDLIVMVTKNGQGILFEEKEVRTMGRSAAGVIGMRLKPSDEVISMNAFSKSGEIAKGYELVTILQNGYGKRTEVVKHFPLQKRGGYGVRASKVSDKTGDVIEAVITNNLSSDLILVSKAGQVIRIPMKSAKLLGRDTQGVRLMRLAPKDMVASVTITDEQKEEDENLQDPNTNNKEL
jgi:DNA gyrase subunit A